MRGWFRKWFVEFLLLSSFQSIAFGSLLALVFWLFGMDYQYALVIGVPFYSIIVALSNALVLCVRPRWAKRCVTLCSLAIHVLAWGEDLVTYFFLSAVFGIVIGGFFILTRGWLIDSFHRTWP